MSAAQPRTGTLAHTWDGRVDSWEQHLRAAPAFVQIRQAVLDAAAITTGDIVVDLGAGNGFLSLPLAASAEHVTAVDLSPAMLAALANSADRSSITNITTVLADVGDYDLPPASVDIVVSSYALHHLTDDDKISLLRRVRLWLRPGGRLVVADMMFGRGATSRDRAIFRDKVVALARKGPGGWWRILKNVARLGLGVGHEQPASPSFWQQQARAAGFATVTYRPLIAEAGLLVAKTAPATAP